MFAQNALVDTPCRVVIVPTDDPKLKAVVIPTACLAQQSQSQTLIEQILATLTNL